MVSIEEIIALQKQDEATKKQSKSGKKMAKGPSGVQGHSFKGKEKEKGIIIKEGASQTKQTTISKDTPQSKQDGKRKVGELIEAFSATRQRTGSEGAVEMFPVFAVEITNERLMIHPHPLFGPMIPFNKDAHLPSKTSASLLNNPMYNLKLARSVIPIPDRQFMMKRNMATNLSEMINLNLKVSVVVVCPLMLGRFDSNLRLCFQMTACLVGAVDLHWYTQMEWEKFTNSYKVAVVKA